MSRKIIYFINPISGTKGKELVIKKIEEKTSSQHIPFEILHTNAEGDYAFLKEKIRLEQITDIVICGGDGTVNQVAASLLGVDINIGIIPMGSGNGLALAAGIPKKPAAALELIFQGQSSPIDAFRINNRFSCMLCGLGFDAKVAHDFSQQAKRGLATYISQTLRNFFNIHPWSFEITNAGKSIQTAAFFISIANSNQFGNQFTIAPKASLNDGLLDIVIVKKMSKLRFVWSVMQQVMSGEIKDYDAQDFHQKDILYFQTNALTIHNLEGAPLHIDGDPCSTTKEFNIFIIPNAFKLIRPK